MADLFRRRISRRDLIRGTAGLGAAGMTIAVIGCDDDGAATPTPGAPTPTAAGPGSPTAAASPTPAEPSIQTGGTLKTWETRTAPRLDPMDTNTAVQRQLAPAFNNLIQADPLSQDPVLIPDLATGWEDAGDGTWTFNLKSGVSFHDGSPFTSEDAKATLERIINPPEEVPSGLQLFYAGMVDSVEATDPSTLVVKLQAPNALFPVLISLTKIVPVRFADSEMTEVVGTGPFMLDSLETDVSLKYVRNPNYHVADRPYLDGIEYFFIEDRDGALTAFRGGQLDYLGGIGLQEEQLSVLRDEPDVVIISGASTIQYGFDLNHTVDPLTDERVRRAIMLAIDNEAAARGTRGELFALGGVMPPGFWALPESERSTIPGYGGDIAARREEARQLLNEAGYGDGLTVRFSGPSSGGLNDLSLIIQSQLREVNVNLDAEFLESSTWSQQRRAGEYVSTVVGASYPATDPVVVAGRHFVDGAPEQYVGFSFQDVNDLYNQVLAEPEQEARLEIAHELDKAILEKLIHKRILWFTWDAAAYDYVRNVLPVYNPFASFHRHENTWLAS